MQFKFGDLVVLSKLGREYLSDEIEKSAFLKANEIGEIKNILEGKYPFYVKSIRQEQRVGAWYKGDELQKANNKHIAIYKLINM